MLGPVSVAVLEARFMYAMLETYGTRRRDSDGGVVGQTSELQHFVQGSFSG